MWNLYLYLTMEGTNPTAMSERHNTYIWPWKEPILLPCQNRTTLTSDHGRNQSYDHVRNAQHLHMTMEGTNPVTMSERHNTYIWPWKEPILSPCPKGTALTSDHGRNQSCRHVGKEQHLHLTMEGTNPLTRSEGHITDTSLPLGRNLNLENTKLLPEVLKLYPRKWLS